MDDKLNYSIGGKSSRNMHEKYEKKVIMSGILVSFAAFNNLEFVNKQNSKERSQNKFNDIKKGTKKLAWDSP